MRKWIVGGLMVLGLAVMPSVAHAQDHDGHYWCYESWNSDCTDALEAAGVDLNAAEVQSDTFYSRTDSAWCFSVLIDLNLYQVMQDTWYFFHIIPVYFWLSYDYWNDIYYYYQQRILMGYGDICPGYGGYTVSSLAP